MIDNVTIINEDASYKDIENNICIGVFGNGVQDRGFINTPYFKVFNNAKPEKATKIARIEFNKYGDVRYGHSNEWELNSKEKKLISNIIHTKRCNIGKGKNVRSMWDSILDHAVEYALQNAKTDDEIKKAKEIGEFNIPDVLNIYDHDEKIYSPNFDSPHKRLGR